MADQAAELAVADRNRGTATWLPPVHDWRFWVVQALVVAVFLLHQLLAGELGLPRVTAVPSLVTEGLFLVPILYAALNFSLIGSLATAATVGLTMLVELVLRQHAFHTVPTLDKWAHVTVLAILGTTSVFVGRRMNQELRARRRAEEATRAWEAAEIRYRRLFETNRSPILVVTAGSGLVRNTNNAAAHLLDSSAFLGVPTLEHVLGADLAARVLADGTPGDRGSGGLDWYSKGRERDVLYRLICTRVADDVDGQLIQILFHDVTEERERQERLARYAAHVLRGQEDERRRIAQELHDDPVQELAEICYRIDAIMDDNNVPDEVLTGLQKVRDKTRSVTESLRVMATGLRPPALDDFGFVAMIRQLVDALEQQLGISASLRVTGHDKRLPPEVELSLFRIGQEALRNVEKHAKAKRVEVQLDFLEKGVALKISDDGVGFTPLTGRELATAPELGLIGMSERAALVNGHLTVHSESGAGTVITVTVPFDVSSDLHRRVNH